MNGFVVVNSWSSGLNPSKLEPETSFDIAIYYDDGQIIRTSVVVDGFGLSYKDLSDTIGKYFKGDLKIKV